MGEEGRRVANRCEQEIDIVHRIDYSGKFLARSCLQAVLMKPLTMLSINNCESRSPGSTPTTHVILRAFVEYLEVWTLGVTFYQICTVTRIRII